MLQVKECSSIPWGCWVMHRYKGCFVCALCRGVSVVRHPHHVHRMVDHPRPFINTQNGMPSQPSSALPSSMPLMSSMPLANNPQPAPSMLEQPLALFDASKLGTSFGTTSSISGGNNNNNNMDLPPPSALQQPGFFSFFGVDSSDAQGLTSQGGVNTFGNTNGVVQQDVDSKSTNNDATTGTCGVFVLCRCCVRCVCMVSSVHGVKHACVRCPCPTHNPSHPHRWFQRHQCKHD